MTSDNSRASAVITLEVKQEDISRQRAVESPTFYVQNVPWKIIVTRPHVLRCYLLCYQRKGPSGFSIATKFKLSVLQTLHHKEITKTFGATSVWFWDLPKKLNDEDKITLELELAAEKPEIDSRKNADMKSAIKKD